MTVGRATICVLVDNLGELELAEAWLAEYAGSLAYVSDPGGCGCCVVEWDIEGPESVIATLPPHLSAGSSWATGS
jgi:hypothetical protein